MSKHNEVLTHLCHKINVIEAMMHENTKKLTESLDISREHQFLITNGINGYKKRIIGDFKSSPQERLYSKIRTDRTLRHPHRKILDFLIDRYDPVQGVFQEVHFSRIVRECRLGKNKAREYLDYLIARDFLQKRSDGYRVWYVISNL